MDAHNLNEKKSIKVIKVLFQCILLLNYIFCLKPKVRFSICLIVNVGYVITLNLGRD